MNGVRFKDIPKGDEFRHRKDVFIKTSPLEARPSAGGAARLFPRSLVVEPLSKVAEPASPAPAQLQVEAVRQAIDTFYEATRQQLLNCGADDLEQEQLSRTHDTILKQLGL